MEKLDPNSRLHKLLQKVISKPITDLKLSAGSNPGDNVIGKMLSVEIETGSGHTETIIVKGLLPYGNKDPEFSTEDKLTAQVMSRFNVYPVELGFYQRIRPELEAHFSKYFIPFPAPKYYYGISSLENGGQDACLILEDLRPNGYRMADKMAGLTEPEVTLVLENIAKFHASSYVYLLRNQPQLLEQLKNNPDSIKDPLAHHIFSTSTGFCEEEHRKFASDLHFNMLGFAQEIGAISNKLYEKICRFHSDPRKKILEDSKQAGRNHFYSVIHGDLWVNNVLFKYDDEGKPVDAIFIDFQQCRYASVFDELHYFIYTSTTRDFREKKLKKLLDYYYDRFVLTLGILKAELPVGFSRKEFHEGYNKYLGSAFCYALIAIPFQVGVAPEAENGISGDVEKSKENHEKEGDKNSSEKSEDANDEKRLKEFVGILYEGMAKGLLKATKNSPVAIERLREICLEMDQLGVFDV